MNWKKKYNGCGSVLRLAKRGRGQKHLFRSASRTCCDKDVRAPLRSTDCTFCVVCVVVGMLCNASVTILASILLLCLLRRSMWRWVLKCGSTPIKTSNYADGRHAYTDGRSQWRVFLACRICSTSFPLARPLSLFPFDFSAGGRLALLRQRPTSRPPYTTARLAGGRASWQLGIALHTYTHTQTHKHTSLYSLLFLLL